SGAPRPAAGVAARARRQPAGRLPEGVLRWLGGAAGAQPGGPPPAVAGGPARDRGPPRRGARATYPLAPDPAAPPAEQAMSDLIDGALTPLLLFLGDWSLRWAVLIAVLALWLRVCRPRNAGGAALLCRPVFPRG